MQGSFQLFTIYCTFYDDVRSGLTHHAPVEELDASPETKDERDAERQQYPTHGECLKCLPVNWRNHGVTHALGGVGERVEKRHDLKPFKRAERSPGIEGTAGKEMNTSSRLGRVKRRSSNSLCS